MAPKTVPVADLVAECATRSPVGKKEARCICSAWSDPVQYVILKFLVNILPVIINCHVVLPSAGVSL